MAQSTACMCKKCWQEYSSPSLVSDKAKAAAKLIAEVYEHSDFGGGLHVVVDDWNLEDGSIEFCQRYIQSQEYRSSPDFDISNERIEAEQTCLRALAGMTQDERGSALAIFYGYLKTN